MTDSTAAVSTHTHTQMSYNTHGYEEQCAFLMTHHQVVLSNHGNFTTNAPAVLFITFHISIGNLKLPFIDSLTADYTSPTT
jgi:hypothetical protein